MAPTWRYAARGAKQLSGAPRRQGDERGADDRERSLAAFADDLAEDVVDDPAEREAADREDDRLPRVQVGDRRVHEPHVGVEVVEDDEQCESREPRRVGLPLEPVERLGHLGRREAVLLRVVEAAAVDAPELARDPGLRVGLVLRRPEREVETNEVEGRADPGDARDDVEHPQADVEDVSQVRVHRSLAIATSS